MKILGKPYIGFFGHRYVFRLIVANTRDKIFFTTRKDQGAKVIPLKILFSFFSSGFPIRGQ